MDSSRKHSLIGRELGVYRIEAVLGSGGMGDVYRGVHQVLDRPVAIKTLKPGIAADEGTLRRFFDEARIVNRIRHENIVEVTDLASEPGGLSYMVMELLQGRTLTDAIREAGRIPPERTARIAAQIADAMAAAHAIDVVHRDLKPDNVFLIRRAGSSDYVKVLDFGISRLKRPPGDKSATQTGALIGTPAYMAPEQASGEKVTAATDIYALGVILFQMVTGRLPFEGASLPEIMYGHLKLEPPKVSDISPDVPAAMTELIAAALHKQPEKRPPSMAYLREQLLVSVGLDPKDFAEAARDAGETGSAAVSARPMNPADPQADSMWNGATIGLTGQGPGLGVKPAEGKPADARAVTPPPGPSATLTDHGARRSPGGPSVDSGSAPARSMNAGPAGATGLPAPDAPPTAPLRPREPGLYGADSLDPAALSGDDLPRVVAVPTPAPSQPAVPADHARTRRNIVLMVAGVIAVLVGALALVLVQRSSGERAGQAGREARQAKAPATSIAPATPDTPSPRERLERASAGHDEPSAPAPCRSVDPELIARLADAAEALLGGTPGGARPDDIRVAEELARAQSEQAEYWYWLAKARLFAGAEAESVNEPIERTLERCRDYAAAHDLLGTLRFRAGEAELAQAAYTRALTLDDGFERARFNMGLTQLQLGRVRDGIVMLTQVLDKRPDMAAALLARGQAYLELQNQAAAIADLEAATRALPGSASGFFALGVAYQREGRDQDAARALCTAADLGHPRAAELCKR